MGPPSTAAPYWDCKYPARTPQSQDSLKPLPSFWHLLCSPSNAASTLPYAVWVCEAWAEARPLYVQMFTGILPLSLNGPISQRQQTRKSGRFPFSELPGRMGCVRVSVSGTLLGRSRLRSGQLPRMTPQANFSRWCKMLAVATKLA